MIIKNAAFIFNLSTNKLYRSKAFETIECSKWTNNNSGAGFGPILDSYVRKSFFYDIKEQNDSHHSSLLTGPNGFLNSSNLLYLFFVLKRFWSFLTFKMVLF